MNLQNPEIQAVSASVIKQENVGQSMKEKLCLAPVSGMKDLLPRIIYYTLKKDGIVGCAYEVIVSFLSKSKFFCDKNLKYEGTVGYSSDQSLFCAAVTMLSDKSLQMEFLTKFHLSSRDFVNFGHDFLQAWPCKERLQKQDFLIPLLEMLLDNKRLSIKDRIDSYELELENAFNIVKQNASQQNEYDYTSALNIVRTLSHYLFWLYRKKLCSVNYFEDYFQKKYIEFNVKKAIDFGALYARKKDEIYEYVLNQFAECKMELKDVLEYQSVDGCDGTVRYVFASERGKALKKSRREGFFKIFGLEQTVCEYAPVFNVLQQLNKKKDRWEEYRRRGCLEKNDLLKANFGVCWWKVNDFPENQTVLNLKSDDDRIDSKLLKLFNSLIKALEEGVAQRLDSLALRSIKYSIKCKPRGCHGSLCFRDCLCNFNNCAYCPVQKLFAQLEDTVQKYMRYKEVEWVSKWKFLQPLGPFLSKWGILICFANLALVCLSNIYSDCTKVIIFFGGLFYLSQREKIEQRLDKFNEACIEFEKYKDDEAIKDLLQAEERFLKKGRALLKPRSGTMYN
ncbi:hypothetical protein IPH25_03340 [bacterium]|nr:MAG: hypothetical protein IPG37_00330 [bacterium]QQR61500.1 MAG: hypothetical protein IPH25_03340 [bacterium]QQR62972.1 MAG: hypothetical protein IPH67_00660 [bacterium]